MTIFGSWLFLFTNEKKKTSGTFKSNSLYMIMNSDQNLYINFDSYLSISLSKCFHITNYLSLHKTFGHSKVVSLRYFGVIFLLWSRCLFWVFFVNQGCGAFSVLWYFSCEFLIIFSHRCTWFGGVFFRLF